jgi:hypothetical protein
VGAFHLGRLSFAHAFDECLREGESLRRALDAHQRRRGQFPESLAELGQPVPGQRWLRPGLMNYQRTASGYELSFGDVFAAHRANQNDRFLAHQ